MDGRTLAVKKRKMAHGEDGVRKFSSLLSGSLVPYVLDIGCGEAQTHANYLRERGCRVDTVDFFDNATFVGNYNDIKLDIQYDGIHAAHILEHQPNPHNFLKKIHSELKEGGWLCITVPPLKHQIVGGHVSLWNAGLVLYHLVLAGFNCANAKILEYGYNISIIVKKETIKKELKLSYTGPDLKTLNPYFPVMRFGPNFTFNGDIKQLNWK